MFTSIACVGADDTGLGTDALADCCPPRAAGLPSCTFDAYPLSFPPSFPLAFPMLVANAASPLLSLSKMLHPYAHDAASAGEDPCGGRALANFLMYRPVNFLHKVFRSLFQTQLPALRRPQKKSIQKIAPEVGSADGRGLSLVGSA